MSEAAVKRAPELVEITSTESVQLQDEQFEQARQAITQAISHLDTENGQKVLLANHLQKFQSGVKADILVLDKHGEESREGQIIKDKWTSRAFNSPWILAEKVNDKMSLLASIGARLTSESYKLGKDVVTLNTKGLGKRANSVGSWLANNWVQLGVNAALVGGTKLAVGATIITTSTPMLASIAILGVSTGIVSGLLKNYKAYSKENENKSIKGFFAHAWNNKALTLKNIGMSAAFGMAGGAIGSWMHDFFTAAPSVDASHALAAAPAASVGVEHVAPAAAPVAAPTIDHLPVKAPELQIADIDVSVAPASPTDQFESLIANDPDVKPSVLKDLAIAQDVNASDAARSHAMANLSYYSLHGKDGVSIDHATAYALSKKALELNPNNVGARGFKDYIESTPEGVALRNEHVMMNDDTLAAPKPAPEVFMESEVTGIIESGNAREITDYAYKMFNGLDGVTKSPADAVKLLQHAASLGDAQAEKMLADLGDVSAYKTSYLPENVHNKIVELTTPPVVETPVAPAAAVEPVVEAKSTPISARHAADCNVDPAKPREALCKVFKPEMENGNYVTATNVQNGQSMTVMLNAGVNEVVPTDGFMKRTLTRSWNVLMSALGSTPETANVVASAAAPAPKI